MDLWRCRPRPTGGDCCCRARRRMTCGQTEIGLDDSLLGRAVADSLSDHWNKVRALSQ